LFVLTVAGGCAPVPVRNYIRDEHSRIVLYHGVNVCNYSKTAPDFLPWHTREDFARLRDWGFNLVRYEVFWEAMEPTEGQWNEAYLDATIERIRWLAEFGIDVVIDVHQDLFARKFGGNGFPAWAIEDSGIPFHRREPWNLNYLEPAVLASYTHFWRNNHLKAKYVAMLEHLLQRVDGEPNVVGVDVMNEPFPGLTFEFESTVLSPFYQDVLDMWTRNHFRSRLFFEPMMFTSAGIQTTLTFAPDTRCVYVPHYYDPLCHEGAPYTFRARLWMCLAMAQRVTEARQFGTPLLIGEFGIAPNVNGYQGFLSDFLDLADGCHVGWTYYSYDKSNEESFGILDEMGRENENLRRLVRVYPQRIAGNNPGFHYRDGYFSLSYDMIDTPAPTVVFVPRHLSGVQVFVNDRQIEFDPQTGCLQVRNESGPGKRQTITIHWD
jgi:endoglycosylceramidase